MPIRLCQKCGLKVLIDESQAGINPFFCQRCTTAMKGQENAPAPGPITPVRNLTPSPVGSMANRSDPAAPSVGAAKPATVRVLCPYCKASFNGRVPQKPARGSCPVCQKELILLPDGDIKPAAGFDLGQWQNEPAAARPPEPMPESEPVPEAPRESGTRLLVKKYAADPGGGKVNAPPPPAARPAAKRAEPARASADTDPSDEPAALPGWLDDSGAGGGTVKPQPETDMNLDAVGPTKDDYEDRTIKVEDPPPPPAPRARSPVVAKMPTVAPGRPPAALVPPPPPPPAPEPEVDLLPDPPPARKALARAPSGERKAMPAPAPAAMAGEPGETGSGKVFLALFLMLLPIAACAGLLASRDKLNNERVTKAGAVFKKGLSWLDGQIFPAKAAPKPKVEEKPREPEPPPKEEPPKADPDQQKKDGDAMSTLYTQILREQRDLKQSSVAATPEQQKQLDQVRKDIDAKKERLKQQQETYRKLYGREYDPANQ
jgi:hypothetical protein